MNADVADAKLDALAAVVRKIERKRPATFDERIADDDLRAFAGEVGTPRPAHS